MLRNIGMSQLSGRKSSCGLLAGFLSEGATALAQDHRHAFCHCSKYPGGSFCLLRGESAVGLCLRLLAYANYKGAAASWDEPHRYTDMDVLGILNKHADGVRAFPWVLCLRAIGGPSKVNWIYQRAAEEGTIPPPAQRSMSERAGATVEEAAGSHAIYVSQPAAAAALIEKAASEVSSAAR
jgi:hypothetical protein